METDGFDFLLAQLVEMGFEVSSASVALRETGGRFYAAMQWLLDTGTAMVEDPEARPSEPSSSSSPAPAAAASAAIVAGRAVWPVDQPEPSSSSSSAPPVAASASSETPSAHRPPEQQSGEYQGLDEGMLEQLDDEKVRKQMKSCFAGIPTPTRQGSSIEASLGREGEGAGQPEAAPEPPRKRARVARMSKASGACVADSQKDHAEAIEAVEAFQTDYLDGLQADQVLWTCRRANLAKVKFSPRASTGWRLQHPMQQPIQALTAPAANEQSRSNAFNYGQERSWLTSVVLGDSREPTSWTPVTDVPDMVSSKPQRSFITCRGKAGYLNELDEALWSITFPPCIKCGAVNRAHSKRRYRVLPDCKCEGGPVYGDPEKRFCGASMDLVSTLEETSDGLVMQLSGRVNRLIAKAEFAAFWRADEVHADYRLRQRRHSIAFEKAGPPGRLIWFPRGEFFQDARRCKFDLSSTQAEVEVYAPQGFLLPLKPQQRQTFGWMCHMEGVLQHVVSKGQAPVEDLQGFLSAQELRRLFPETDLEAVVRIQRLFRKTSGGILADAVGYGKTCCMLALIAATKHLPKPGLPDSGGLIPSKATLIITPPNLFEQWKVESEKFLGREGAKVIAVSNAHHFKSLTVEDMAEADIIVVPYRLFFHEGYRKHCDSITSYKAPKQTIRIPKRNQLNTATDKWFKDVAAEAKRRGTAAKYTDIQGLLGCETGDICRFEELQCMPSWSQFFRENPKPREEQFEDKFEERDDKTDSYQAIRIARLEALGRALARQVVAETAADGAISSEPGTVYAMRNPALEMFCFRRICFDEFHEMSAFEQKQAGNECLAFNAIRLIRAPRRWGLTATPKLERATDVSQMAEILQIFVQPDNPTEAQHFLDHFARSNNWDLATIPVEYHTVEVSLTGRERALYMSHVERYGQRAERCVQLCSHFAPGDVCKDSNQAVEQTRQKQQEEKKDLEQRIAERQAQVDNNLCGSFEERRAVLAGISRMQHNLASLNSSIKFFEDTLKSLDSEKSSVECSICLDDACGDSLAMTPCGHLFHDACVAACIAQSGLCPQCRKALTPGCTIGIAGLGSKQAPVHGDHDIKRYGSKLCAILTKAQELCEKDPQCKIIMFVQWEGLLRKVGAALGECGLPCLRITGTVQQRQITLKKFQDSSASEHRVLLLSLEKSPSGMTLTCANHVFLVHPMLAESPTLAEGYERQAIGRVRRPGQEKTVHIWRFITGGTVEETLTQENRLPSASA